jgi:hypothetical protein
MRQAPMDYKVELKVDNDFLIGAALVIEAQANYETMIITDLPLAQEVFYACYDACYDACMKTLRTVARHSNHHE